MTGEEIRVSYGVKELLGRIDIRLESIDNKLDAKADLRDVVDLKSRIEAMERRESARIAVQNNQKEVFSRREKMIGLFIAALAIVIQPLLSRYHIYP